MILTVVIPQGHIMNVLSDEEVDRSSLISLNKSIKQHPFVGNIHKSIPTELHSQILSSQALKWVKLARSNEEAISS